MAITGVSSISGQQIIAAGALSAASAGTALFDENGNPITGYLTAVPEGYATTGDLTAYQTTAGMTAYQGAGDYAYNSALTSKLDGSAIQTTLTPFHTLMVTSISGYYISAGYANYANTALYDENGNKITSYYATTAGMTAYQPVGDYYSASNPSGFITAVPAGTMNESEFEYDSNNNISAYNGSAFAGGSDVPEGVMVESGLEYNAVNEISGYNGSAIAQYGAEKQWLVHDDTLVHAANSAQYALGVNLSAVAQLLGVDETILWSGSKGSIGDTIDLSEPVSAFNKIKFQIDELNEDIPYHEYVGNTNGTILYPYYMRTNSNSAQVCGMWSLNRINNDTRLSVAVSIVRTNGSTTGVNGSKLIKVIGIGRKEV